MLFFFWYKEMGYAHISIDEYHVGYKDMLVNDYIILQASTEDILKDSVIRVDEGDVIINHTSNYSTANLSLFK